MTPLGRLLAVPVRGYRRWVSPLLGQHCRFAPSCSAYAVTALETHGALRGSWLALRRLAPAALQPAQPRRLRPRP